MWSIRPNQALELQSAKRSSKSGIGFERFFGTKMSTVGLQNEVFLRPKSVPKSTQNSDLENRGFPHQDARGRKRTQRVGGSGGAGKSTEIYRYILEDGH